jgi:hypothetical protein
MNNKIIWYVLAACVAFSTTVYAQAQEKSPSVDDRVAKMATELSLTDAQTQAVKPIIAEYITKRDKVLEEVEGEAIVDHAALRSTMTALKKDEYQKLGKVLSEDQLRRWVQRENLRAALNKGDMGAQASDDTTFNLDGAAFKF